MVDVCTSDGQKVADDISRSFNRRPFTSAEYEAFIYNPSISTPRKRDQGITDT